MRENKYRLKLFKSNVTNKIFNGLVCRNEAKFSIVDNLTQSRNPKEIHKRMIFLKEMPKTESKEFHLSISN